MKVIKSHVTGDDKIRSLLRNYFQKSAQDIFVRQTNKKTLAKGSL